MTSSATTTGIEHFDALGAEYERAFEGLGLEWVSARECNIVRGVAGALPDSSLVLDMGVGTGRIASVLIGMGHRVVGADPAPAMVTVARRNLPGTEVVEAGLGAEPLPFQPGQFDAAFAIRVLKWCPNWKASLSELARVVRPGGTLVVEVANRRSLARLGYARTSGVSSVTMRQLRKACVHAGLQVIEIRHGTHLPFFAWRLGTTPIRVAILAAMQRVADRLFGRFGARSLVFVTVRLPHQHTPDPRGY